MAQLLNYSIARFLTIPLRTEGTSKGVLGHANGVTKHTSTLSTYIPAACKHWMENLGTGDLVMLGIIEVQSGGYLGEDEIVWVDDIYGRV